ncbi:MAG: DUF4159 domain-containing protein [Phycisphaerales bacterium]|nr:DUF4159 domain-containing protein [Phycisphaerales bacterium]
MVKRLLHSVAALTLGLAVGFAQTQPASSPTPTTASQPSIQDATQPTSNPATMNFKLPGPPPPTAAEFPRYEPGLTDDQVVAAIKKGADFLLSKKKGDNFEESDRPWAHSAGRGGETALIVYALLTANQSIDEPEFRQKTNFLAPELAPVIEYLKSLQPDGTYTAALSACALTSLPKTPEMLQALERRNGPRNYLFHATSPTGGYEYVIPGSVVDAKINDLDKQLADLRAKQSAPGKKEPDEAKQLADQIKNKVAEINKARADADKQKAAIRKAWNPDGSNTQYGVLGAWALANYGILAPAGYWIQQDNYWRNIQLSDGGFPYAKNDKFGRETMAPAGLASLILTQEFLDVEPRLEPRIDKHMNAAIKHIAENFNPKPNDQYYGYGIERVGVASGLKFFGTHEWYRELAYDLIQSQAKDGSWAANFYVGRNTLTIPTCYSLIILARGRSPVLINKLDYGIGGYPATDIPPPTPHWNNRSRDVARLTEKLAKSFERPLNWQVITHLAKPDDWMDAPILYISGSQDPKLPDEDVEKLRAYIEMGGIIFSNPDGESGTGSGEFTDAVRKLAARVIPGREMRTLPPTHPLFNGELWTKIPNPPKVLALSNGIREVWLHSCSDMGATWHKRSYDIKSHWDFPGNLYFYATGKVNLKNRLQSPVVNLPPEPPIAALTQPAAPNTPNPPQEYLKPATSRLLVGRLLIGDNPNPEPGAWPRMARLMRLACNIDMQSKLLTLAQIDKMPTPPIVLHLTGTTSFTLPETDVAILRAYLDKGGTLLADSGGMSPEFTQSFQKLCAQLYPNVTPMIRIPLDSPIYLTDYAKNATSPSDEPAGQASPPTPSPTPNNPTQIASSIPSLKGYPILAVRYRPSYMLERGPITTPHLQGLRLTPTSRFIIIFSEEDLTSGLLGTNTWGIMGCTSDSARALIRNMLLYVMHRVPPSLAASTQPATQPAQTRPATP